MPPTQVQWHLDNIKPMVCWLPIRTCPCMHDVVGHHSISLQKACQRASHKQFLDGLNKRTGLPALHVLEVNMLCLQAICICIACILPVSASSQVIPADDRERRPPHARTYPVSESISAICDDVWYLEYPCQERAKKAWLSLRRLVCRGSKYLQCNRLSCEWT